MTENTVEDRRAEWWNAWWQADYSWEGLGKRRVPGWFVRPDGRMTRDRGATPKTRPATLQDVWRSEAPRLVTDGDGNRWTVVHVPPVWKDQTLAKAAWTEERLGQMDRAFADAIARFPSDDLGPPQSPSVDDASRKRPRGPRSSGFPLDGVVLVRIPELVAALEFIRGDYLAVIGDSVARVGRASINLRWALFEPVLVVGGDEIVGQDISLFLSVMVRGAVFTDAKPKTLTLRALSAFGNVDFDLLEIAGPISLRGSIFRGEVNLEDVKASVVELASCRIGRGLRLSDVKADLDFRRTSIAENLFLSDVRCTSVDAAWLTVAGSAELIGLEVSDRADFSDSTWASPTKLKAAKFQHVSFDDAKFSDKVSFANASFRGRVSFARAHFQNSADFGGALWPNELADQEGAFRETKFDSFADFQRGRFRAFSAFNGATFKAEIRFDPDVLNKPTAAREALRHAKSENQKVALEHGFRALRQAAESVRNRNQEQALFRYELIARRSQAGTPWGERLMSAAYGGVSSYGSSCWRPVATAVAVWLAFGLVYLWLGTLTSAEVTVRLVLLGGAWHPLWPEALGISGRSMFNLFGIWTPRMLGGAPSDGAAHLLEAGLLGSSPTLSLATRLLSSVQSILSGVLLFLVALAARRRFQIS